MNSSYDRDLYHPSDFDDDMCLKPPLLLWLAVFYLARAIVLPIAIGIGHVAGVDASAFAVLRSEWTAEGLLPALAAVPVLYALLRRGPGADRAARWIWTHGRILLAVSAAIDAARCSWDLGTSKGLGDASILPIGSGLVDVYFLAFILLARRLRDTFRDFPPPH